MNLRWPGCILTAMATAGLVNSLAGAEPLIEASLEVVPAETYVLGDDVPLIWEFTNRSTNSVAMLWEGCCRLNGKLDIQSAGQPVETLPPGASAFHSFSKAAELIPQEPNKFSSLLSDWVKLPHGGTFSIGGRYTGVLPSQTPQVEEGLDLWRGTVFADATQLNILSVSNYLNQRDERGQLRGIELSLSGPTSLPPVDPISLSLKIANLSSTRREVAWPGTMQLWIVDENGFRLAQGTKHLRMPGEVLSIEPNQSVVREFQFSSSDLSGDPFGNYQVFVDLGETETSTPRVPSNSINVDWDLSVEDLVQLLNDASAGPSAGMRNPPLKLLRLYLSKIAQRLPTLPDARLDEKAVRLKQQLELASCVQPISPKPGIAILKVAVDVAGAARLQLPDNSVCKDAMASGTGVKQLEAIYDIRRHLGWDLGVQVVPEFATAVDSIFDYVSQLDSSNLKVARPLFALWTDSDGQTNTVHFLPDTVSANVVVRMSSDDDYESFFIAATDPNSKRPAWMNVFSSGQVMEVQGERVNVEDLSKWMETRASTSSQVTVILEGPISWERFV